MTNENRIKTALLNEVIEMIKGNIKSGRLGEYEYRNNAYTRGLIKQVQSLLPKEEPERQIKEPIIRCNNCNQEVKPEPTKDIKAGEKVEVRDGECDKWQDGWVFTGGYNLDGLYICEREHFLEPFNYIRKPTKTQEEMDREKALQLLIDLGVNGGHTHEVKMNFVLSLINESRKTKQD